MPPQEPSAGGGVQSTGDPELDAILAQIAAGGAQAALPQPLGVPEGYVAPPRRHLLDWSEVPPGTMGPLGFATTPVAPRYYEGMEFIPAGLPVEELAELQRRMFDAGLYSPEEGRVAKVGIWDDSSLNAYSRLLGFANQTGMEADEALAEYRERTEAGGFSGAGQLRTNPQDIAYLANQTALRRMGRELDPQQLAAFEKSYRQNVEIQPELGVAPPSPEAFADTQIEAMDPQGVTDYRIRQAGEEWFNAIRSPVGG